MDMNRDKQDPWVDAQLRALDPPAEWEPSEAVALARFRARVDEEATTTAAAARWRWMRPWTWSWTSIAAAAAACLLIVMLPATRAAAQRLWDVMWVGRLEVVSLDTNNLPSSLGASSIRLGGKLPAATPEEAARLAGFTPRLPPAVVRGVSGPPTLSVVTPWSAGMKVNVADLRDALAKRGITDLVVPQEWDGAQITANIGTQVFVEYPDIEFGQCQPIAVTVTPGLDMRAFTEVVLRLAGMSPSAARTFSLQLGSRPAVLLPIEPGDKVSLREVRLRTGVGTLLHDFEDEDDEKEGARKNSNVQRTTLMWSVPDRLYMISASASDDVIIALANSIQ